MPRFPAIAVLIALNALPVFGVLNWGWQSFDLIFLYWLENLIIGLFMLFRMLLRPYRHPIDYLLPLFFAPFFTIHYGMFCLVHGGFVFSLFAPENTASSGFFGVLGQIWPTLQSNHLLWAAACLLLLQAFDWIRDLRQHGLGFGGVKDLMVAPYRRIVVLHIGILVSGFALTALHEPIVGLVALVLVKTAFDVYHWRKDARREAGNPRDVPELTPDKLRQMHEQFAEPEIEVNGKKLRFDSFQALKNSSQFRTLTSIMRMFGRSQEYKLIETFLDMKIAEENGEQPFAEPGAATAGNPTVTKVCDT